MSLSISPLLLNNSSFFFHKSSVLFKLIFFLLLLFQLLILSCSPAKRFTEKEQRPSKEEIPKEENTLITTSSELGINYSEIRVSLNGLIPEENLLVGSLVNLYNGDKKVASINSGNTISCYNDADMVELGINNQIFSGEKFFLASVNNEDFITLNGKRYRGRIQISASGNSIIIINVLPMEDYVKGVLAKEMPIGKGEENLEALKALAICIRTYAIQKIKDGKVHFDIYSDTRDQVYGGVNAETPLSNRATDATQNIILKYEGEPAIVFYHSTCGGYTEAVDNVFTTEEIPYLISVKDGNDPNCIISPKFNWEEKYTRELIVERLKKYSLLDNQNYTLEDIEILNRFDSGRVNEIKIIVEDEYGEEQSLIIQGNEIRGVIRNADGKSILWSTMFDISSYSSNIILSGRGFGHGVGLCQWGAISLSKKGWGYDKILYQYFPGTTVGKLND